MVVRMIATILVLIGILQAGTYFKFDHASYIGGQIAFLIGIALYNMIWNFDEN